MGMTLEDFAQRYKTKIKKDSIGDAFIAGRLADKKMKDRPEYHQHIYAYDGGKFAVFMLYPTNARWNSARKQLEALGATTIVNAECEGIIRFDPNDAKLVGRIIKLAGIRVKREMTEEQKTKLRERLCKKG